MAGKKKAETKEKPTKTEDSIAVTGVSISPKTVSLKVGGGQKLTATVEPSDATDKTISFETSANQIATVNNNGLVTAIAEGSSTITVTTSDGGFTDTTPVTVEAVPVVDLSLLSSDHWPGNYVLRKSSVYLDIEEITLNTNQTGRMIQTPEGFVLERVDIAVLKAPAMDVSLKFAADSNDIAQFSVSSNSTEVERKEVSGLQAGDYLPETWINLVNLGNKPEGEGRLAISFIGYLIEPWR